MPRAFGRFTTTIHRSPEFRALTLAQQGAYFLLGLQPEVTAAGVLSLTLRRWSDMAAECTPADIEKALDVLQDCGHVVVDEFTEELILVKFIKWDDGWKNSKRLPVVMDAVGMISSVHIRDIAVDELRKIADGHATSDGEKQARFAVSRELIRAGYAVTGFEGNGVTEGESVPEPQTANHKPHSGNPEGEPVAANADDPLSEFCPEHQPNGPDGKPCTRCADRKRARREAKRRADAVNAADAADRLACRRCNDDGFIEGPGGELLGKCGHSDLALVVGGTP